MIKLYVHPRCSTCKKAEAFLLAKQIAYATVDITVSPPTYEELEKMLHAYKGDKRAICNTSGQLYRSMEMKEKIAFFSEQEFIALLAENGMLVKRPFLVSEPYMCVGFKEKVYAAIQGE